MRRLGPTAAAALWLAGCATVPPPPPDLLSGRIAVRVEASDGRAPRAFSAGFDLRGGAEAGELRLSSPLGTMLATARWSHGGAWLVTAAGETAFEDLDALSRAASARRCRCARCPTGCTAAPGRVRRAVPRRRVSSSWAGASGWRNSPTAASTRCATHPRWSPCARNWTGRERSRAAVSKAARGPARRDRAQREGAPVSLRALLDVPAPAKLNLFLHVVGRRADGYHLIESVFVLIDWCDLLHFERRDDGALARHDLGPALPADDLCLRAARRLQRESGCPLGADITLDKRVPWGAGLGGGSSDAASTLLALNRLWGLRWPRERLLALALQLGADVPFFVGGTNAFVEGIGERLTPLPPGGRRRCRGAVTPSSSRHRPSPRATSSSTRRWSATRPLLYSLALSWTLCTAKTGCPTGRGSRAATICSPRRKAWCPRWRKPPAGSKTATATAA
jgi:hypothetical protein